MQKLQYLQKRIVQLVR